MTVSPQSPPPPRRHEGSENDQQAPANARGKEHGTARGTARDDAPSTSAPDTDRIPHPRQGGTRQGNTEGRSQTAVERTKRRRRSDPSIGTASGTQPGSAPAPLLTPEEWAQEQLKNAPPRSRAWAREVAAIYGLDLPKEE